MTESKILRCGFCGFTQNEVKQLFQGQGGACICNDCILASIELMRAAGLAPPCEKCADVDALYAQKVALISTPRIDNFLAAVETEAQFQRHKWSADDGDKTDAAWFWLIGYLAGKALHNPPAEGTDPREKQLHRIITVAAAAYNWWAAKQGGGAMRPGIAEGQA